MKEPRIRFKEFGDGWQTSKIENVAKVESCKRIYKSETSHDKSIPFYKIGNFGGETDTYIDKDKYLEYRKKYPYPKQGDILISASGTLGKTIVYRGENAYYQDSNIIWLNINKEKIINPFLLQLYKIINWNVDEGSTIKRLYNRDILNANIYLPSINEQHKIGQFFQKLDQLIKMQSDKLDHLKRDKEGYLQKMFANNNKKMPILRFYEFKNNWQKSTIGKNSNIIRGASPRPIKDSKWFNQDSDVGWLRISDVTNQNGRIRFIKQKLSKLGEEKTRVLTSPHLLLSIAASVGLPAINYVSTGVHDGFVIFKNLQIDKMFMFQWLLNFKPKWRKYGQPGSQLNLNSNLVSDQEIYLPNHNEQHRIGQFFSHLDHLINLQQQKINHLKQLKQAYLQKMFV